MSRPPRFHPDLVAIYCFVLALWAIVAFVAVVVCDPAYG